MKKQILLLVILACYLNFSNAQWQQANGPYGGIVNCFAISGGNIFAGTSSGVYLSANNGISWSAVDSGMPYIDVVSLAVSGSNIFAGVGNPVTYIGGGVYLSTNNGNSWVAVDSGLPANTYVNVLAVSRNNIFAGTNSGVYLSTNNGSKWTTVNSGLTDTLITSFVVKDTNIFVGTQGGVYLSSDSGKSWTLKNNGFDFMANSIWSLALSGDTIYAGTSWGFYKSTDNGDNWIMNSLLPGGPYTAIATSGSKILTCYLGTLFFSSDNGESWATVDSGLPLLFNNFNALLFSGNKILTGSFVGINASTNNGNNWIKADSGFINTYVNTIATNGSTIVAGTGNPLNQGTSSGVYLSDDNGNSWTERDSGITDDYINAVAVNGNNIFVGKMAYNFSYGMLTSSNNGGMWSGGFVYNDVSAMATSGSNTYAASNEGIYKTTDNGNSWISIDSAYWAAILDTISIPVHNYFINALAIKGNNIFAGTANGVYLYNGSNWSVANSGLPINTTVRALAVCGRNIFAGTDSGIYWSVNNGSSWTAVNSGLTNKSVKALGICGSIIFAGTSSGVYLSTNNGNSWSALNTGLPANTPVNCIALDNKNVYIGAGGYGVYKQALSGFVSFYVTPTSLNVSDTAKSTATFKITSNTNWNVSSNQPWLTVSDTMGSDSTTITVIVLANHASGSRVAKVIISGSGAKSDTVTVTQAASPATLSVSTTTLNVFAPANSTATFDIISNISWNVSSNQPWLTVSNTSGSDSATITVTALANTNSSSRVATVTISGSGLSKNVTITQAAGSTGIMEISESEIQIYPIPAIDKMYISFSKTLSRTSVYVFSITGEPVYFSKIDNSITEIDMSKFASGIYFIKIVTKDDVVLIKKIIKQ